MTEKIFNVFLFVESEVVIEMGAVCHTRDGSDEEKIAFLQAMVDRDYRVARKYPLPDWCVMVKDGESQPRRISYEAFLKLQAMGKAMHFLEVMFADMKAPAQPLMVITAIVDGRPRINAVMDLDPQARLVKP